MLWDHSPRWLALSNYIVAIVQIGFVYELGDIMLLNTLPIHRLGKIM